MWRMHASMSWSICIIVIFQYLVKQHWVLLISMQTEKLKEILGILIYKKWDQSYKVTWNAYVFTPKSVPRSSDLSVFLRLTYILWLAQDF